MDFGFSDRSLELQRRVRDFMDEHVIPRHAQFKAEEAEGKFHISFMDDLKALAKEEGLWNLFLPGLKEDEPGTRLTNLEYAPLAEIMGRLPWASPDCSQSTTFSCVSPAVSGAARLLPASVMNQFTGQLPSSGLCLRVPS